MHLVPEARRMIDALMETPGEGRPVAFDADGTLWRGDIGEDLLRYLAAHDLLPQHRGRRGVYDEYERRVAQDPADAYAYAVEVMEGMEEAALREECAAFYRRRFEGRLLPYARTLVKALREHGFAVWVVSASPWWPVVAAAEALGIPESQVIAVRSPVRNGVVTRDVERPVPCGEGKVHWLRERGVRPVLALGNGDLDLPMLAYAERAIAVAPHGEDNLLVRAARERGWPIQRC